MCSSGKAGYRSRIDAEIKAQSVREWYGTTQRPYRCDECGNFHLTTVKGLDKRKEHSKLGAERR